MSTNPLEEQIGRLVGNLLAGGGAVFLPGVGSLYTERQGARRLDRRRVMPPCRVVEFTSGQRGVSLVDEIARVLHPDGAAPEEAAAEAQAVYDRWIERVHRANLLIVEGVGVLKFRSFTPEEAFERRLNPQGREPVRIRAPRRFDWALWVGVAAILVALLYGGREFLMLYTDDPAAEVAARRDSLAASSAAAGAVVPGPQPGAVTPGSVVADGTQPNAGSAVAQHGVQTNTGIAGSGAGIADPSAGYAAAASDGIAVSGGTAGSAAAGTLSGTDRSVQGARPNAGSGLSGHDAGMKTESDPYGHGAGSHAGNVAARDVSGGGTTIDSSQAGRLAGTGSDASADMPDGARTALMALLSGRHYVVLGVFSTEANAQRSIRETAAKEPAFRCRIYRFGEKFMVSPFSSDEARVCTAFIRAQSGRFPGMWTYTAR